MENSLRDQFIEKLTERYGPWDKVTSRFGNATFGEMAMDLCISASQFSKLISGAATEGMYTRSIRNVERLIREDWLEKNLAADQQELPATKGPSSARVWAALSILFFVLAVVLAFSWFKALQAERSVSFYGQHPLSPFFDKPFDAAFDSPYLEESEAQTYCPCSAYEGKWSLARPYKLPLPGSRKPGVYYVAKSGDIRMKCSKIDTLGLGKGRVLLGYEYLINEIWVDTRQTPLSPTYFDKESKQYTEAFEQLDFEQNPQFKKVATIYSFFTDRFILGDDYITRIGEPCGRFAENIDEELAAEYEIDLKHILDNVVGDLVKTNCQPLPNPFCDPNTLVEGESVLNFDCLYTIESENLGLGGGYPYTKGYLLEQQSYSDNLTCTCEQATQ